MINAYIKLVAGSVTQEVTLDDVKDLLHYYQEITSKTGSQLDWDYSEHAFPYKITKEEEDYFVLESKDSRYRSIIIGVGKEHSPESSQSYIQVSLPQQSTHGDKGKANEFCKFLGKKLEGELHLFNSRVMYYYKRK